MTLAAALSLFVFSACKTLPENLSPRRPKAELVFERMEASNPSEVMLYLLIRADNPRGEGAAIKLSSGSIFVNGSELSGGYAFRAADGGLLSGYAEPFSQEEIRAVCVLDMKLLPQEDAGIEACASLELGFDFEGGASEFVRAETFFSFPRVREPEFSVVSIAVMQAELINTRLKVKIKIRNPNPFPLILSAFSYELYGGGYLWADGDKKNLCEIGENDETEESLFIVMNFIDMRRDLLDQVIAMRNVRYRFTGEVEIGTGIAYLPRFVSLFDLRGDSEVLR
jgi:LEA14-like dessication related protein